MSRLLLLIFAAFVFSACTPSITRLAADQKRLDALQSAMTGSYDSSAQADIDSSYYNIALHMQPIWADRDGHYLYVEQALASTPEEPYRQRVYKLETKGNKVISRVYELPDPDRFVGGHEDPARFAVVAPADLVEREGCAVILKADKDGVYRGSTRKKDCKSSLRGASYATSRVSIDEAFIQSWDQGFDAEDKQVWGAEKGGYMFFKQ